MADAFLKESVSGFVVRFNKVTVFSGIPEGWDKSSQELSPIRLKREITRNGWIILKIRIGLKIEPLRLLWKV